MKTIHRKEDIKSSLLGETVKVVTSEMDYIGEVTMVVEPQAYNNYYYAEIELDHSGDLIEII